MENLHIAAQIKALVQDHKPGRSLAQSFYTDPDVYKADIDRIFFKHWLFAGHVSQISETGDYVLCEFDTESIIVVRTASGEIKAYANLCRHRGSKICLEPLGKKKHFMCPYHAWTYNLDGQLILAGQMPEGFDPSENNLHGIHVEIIRGLIFISLAEEPLSLDKLKADLSEVFDILDLGGLKLAKTKSYPIASNWKLAVENYQECYHCAPSHKAFSKIHAMSAPLKIFESKKEKYRQDQPLGGLMSEFNYYFDLAQPSDEGFQYGRNPLVAGKVSGSEDGSALSPLLGNLATYSGGASELMIGPLMYFLIYDDHMVGYRFLPVSKAQTVCDVYWFVRSDAVDGRDFDSAKLTWLWGVTTQEDKRIIENNQTGVNSRFYQPGHLSDMEHFLQSFLRWYIQSLS